MYEDEFEEKYLSSPYIDTLKVMTTQIKSQFNSVGQQVTRENIFRYLLQPAIQPIAQYTSQELVSRRKKSTTESEIWEFIATKHLRSTHNATIELPFQLMQLTAKEFRFKLLPIDRYNDILYSLRGFDVSKRNAQDEAHIWMQQGNMLRHLSPIGKRYISKFFVVI